MQCCRCNLQLDSGHHTGGGIYEFSGAFFCKPCLLGDDLWQKTVESRLAEAQRNIRRHAILRRFVDEVTGPPTIVKVEQLALHKCEIPVVDVWNNVHG